MASRAVVMLVFLLTGACGANEHAPPAPSPTDVLSTSLNTWTVRGHVYDGPFPLVSARVEVVEGVGSGNAVTTSANGGFELSGLAGEVQIRASRDGFQTQTRRITTDSNKFVGFSLTPLNSANLAGLWRLTIEASPSCQTLADFARRRTYLGTVQQANSTATVQLSGAEFFELVDDRNEIRYNEFQGSVSEKSVQFLIDRYGPSGVIERTGENGFVGISGIAEGLLTPTSVSGALNGHIRTYDGQLQPHRTTSSCDGDHRFTLERITSGR